MSKTMKKLITILLFASIANLTYAQSTTITPANVAANSTTKPIILPRLTFTAIWAIPNPTKGTMVYDLTNNVLRSFNGNNWVHFKSIGTDITPNMPSSARKESEISTPPAPNPQIPSKK